MATRNAFDLLTDFTSDDPSLLACDRLRSADPPKADRPAPVPRFLPLKKCREIEDQDNRLLESGFGKKSRASDNRRIDKEVTEVIGGEIRGVVNKGVKRSLLDDPNNKMMCGRKREVVDDVSKDFVRASAKNRHYNFCGFTGRSSLARKMSEAKRGGTCKSNRCKDRWWVEDEYLDILESDRVAYEDLDDILSDDAFEKQVIRSFIAEDDFDDKMMTLEQYGKVMEEKKQVLQATLLEISAKRQEEEDFINEFVIIEAEDDELEADELDDFLLV